MVLENALWLSSMAPLFTTQETTALVTKTASNKAKLLHLLSPKCKLLTLHKRAISSPGEIATLEKIIAVTRKYQFKVSVVN